MLTINSYNIGWRFWVKWVLFTCVGYSLGFFVASLSLIFIVFAFRYSGRIPFTIVLSAGVGLMQWLVLQHVKSKKAIDPSGWWVLASIAGLTIPIELLSHTINMWDSSYSFYLNKGYLDWGNNMIVPAFMGLVLAFFIAGACIGFLQMLILHRYISISGWWILVSAAAWSLSVIWLVIYYVFFVSPRDVSSLWHFFYLMLINAFLIPGISGIILGAITGGALLWLMLRPLSSEVS